MKTSETKEITFSDICRLFPKRNKDAHKGDFGRLLCITGSKRMPGAAAMSSYAALRCGVGLLTTATALQNIPSLSSHCFESMYIPLLTDEYGFITWKGNEGILSDAVKRSDAVLVGCGLGLTEQTFQLTKNIIQLADCPLIIDADGLNAAVSCIDIISERKNPTILTPHPGEMARILKTSSQNIQNDRLCALNKAMELIPNAVIVLKGSGTLVGQSEKILLNTTGNPGMSRGGSGDVLAGMIASFSAQGLGAVESAAAGVFIHGMAGDIAARKLSEQSMLPRDLISCIPEVFKKIEENR
ncbi:MAG: NAD(P)H-hydrate dehydratase [Ruminococcus sp.]